MTAHRSNAEWSRLTREALLKRAHQQFASQGYAGTTTEALVRRTGATRGALYFHFSDKRGLFEAVTIDVAAMVQARVEAAAGCASSPLEAVLEGCRAWLEAVASDEARQILLVDAPAVLGWKRWRDIDAAHSMGSLRAGLEACGQGTSAVALTHLISGALNEVALAVGEGGLSLEEATATTMRMLRSVLAESQRGRRG